MITYLDGVTEGRSADPVSAGSPGWGDPSYERSEIRILDDVVKDVAVDGRKHLHPPSGNRERDLDIHAEAKFVYDQYLGTMVGQRLHEDPGLLRGGGHLDTSRAADAGVRNASITPDLVRCVDDNDARAPSVGQDTCRIAEDRGLP